MGLDYGDKTIGVAISDPLGIMALGLETIRRDRADALKASFRRLSELFEEYAPVDTVVLGFPKNLNNTEGERCAKTRVFEEKLIKRFKGIKVILWDERLSTAAARRTLSGAVHEKAVIDEMAAVFILQGYMDFKNKDAFNKEVKQMTGFDAFDGFDAEDSAITMLDEDGNEIGYRVLANKKDGDCLYLLAEEEVEDTGPEAIAEVLIFKCVSNEEAEEMIFELVDENHDSFDLAFTMFKEDFDAFSIEY